MKSIRYLALALSAAACGGGDETVLINDGLPPGVIRLDGDVERDHIFYDEEHYENYCGAFPESPACSELGSAEQPWVSAEFHGVNDNNSDVPCFGQDSDNGTCFFPLRKKLKYIINEANCFPTLNDATHDPVDLLDGTAIIEGIKNGLDRWHNIASGVTVENNACTSGTCMTVNVSCTNLGGAVGLGGLSGVSNQVVSNLPSGPTSGVDQGAARTINGGVISFDPGRILAFFKTSCDSTPSRAQLRTYTRYVSAHETGHVFGFGHFDEGPDNLMFPFSGCEDVAAPVIQPFGTALGALVSSGANSTILDINLENQGP